MIAVEFSMDTAKVLAIIFVVLTIAHMTYFALHPYSPLLFFLGFGILYGGVIMVRRLKSGL